MQVRWRRRGEDARWEEYDSWRSRDSPPQLFLKAYKLTQVRSQPDWPRHTHHHYRHRFKDHAMGSDLQTRKTRLCIIGSGPAAHTAAIYAARAELKSILFEGCMANDIAPGGQLTTTSEVENFPGFPDGLGGGDLMERFRAQSLRFGTQIFTETVFKVDLSASPFKIFSDQKTVLADSVVVSTGAVAKLLNFPGSDTFWNRGISACAVCDGAAPIFRNNPLAVIGGGDSAMEEANFIDNDIKFVLDLGCEKCFVV